LKDLGTDGRILIKGSSRSGIGGHGLDCSDSRYGLVAGCGECRTELSGYIKCWVFLD
jgi:hypothetical protein